MTQVTMNSNQISAQTCVRMQGKHIIMQNQKVTEYSFTFYLLKYYNFNNDIYENRRNEQQNNEKIKKLSKIIEN